MKGVTNAFVLTNFKYIHVRIFFLPAANIFFGFYPTQTHFFLHFIDSHSDISYTLSATTNFQEHFLP